MPADSHAYHEVAPSSTGKGHKRPVYCQVRNCSVNPTSLGKQYFVRKKICSAHLIAESVFLDSAHHGDEPFRFCQQCGKLEPLTEFEGAKRSCRLALQRRRLSKQQTQSRSRKRPSSDTSEEDDHTPEPWSSRARKGYTSGTIAGSQLANAYASGPCHGEQEMQPQQGFGKTSFWSMGHFAYSSAAAAASLGPAAAGVSPPLLQQLTDPDQAASTGAECEGLRGSLTTASTTGLNNIQFSGAGVAAAAAVGVDIAPSWLALCEASQAQQAEAQQTEAHQQQQNQQANRVANLPPSEQAGTGDRVWDEMLQAVCDSSPATDDVIIDLLASQLTTAAPEDGASKQQQQAAAAALAQGGGYPATHNQDLASPDPVSVGSRAGAADVDHADPDPQHLLHIIHQQQYQLHQQQQQQYQLQQQLQQLFPTQMDPRQSTPPVDALLASTATAAAAQLAATCGLATPQGPATTWGSTPAGAAGNTAICQQQWIAPTSDSTIPHTAAHSSTYPAAVPSQQTLLTPVPTSAPVEFNAIHNLVQLESTLGILSQQLAHFQSGVHQSVVQLLGANVQGQQQMLVPVGPATDTPQYTATAVPAQARGSEHGEVQNLVLQATSLQSPLQSPIMLG